SWGSEVAKVGDSELRQVGKNGGKRGRGIADESEANVVNVGPFAMRGNTLRDGGRYFFAGQSFQNLGFSEIGIVEDDWKNLSVAFGEKSACDAGWTAASQGDFLSERELWEAGEDLLFGVALEFGVDGGREGELYEVHQIEIAQKAEADEARSASVES